VRHDDRVPVNEGVSANELEPSKPERGGLLANTGLLVAGIGLILLVVGASTTTPESFQIGLGFLIFGGFAAVCLEVRALRPKLRDDGHQ
jgi:hypothetical protein